MSAIPSLLPETRPRLGETWESPAWNGCDGALPRPRHLCARDVDGLGERPDVVRPWLDLVLRLRPRGGDPLRYRATRPDDVAEPCRELGSPDPAHPLVRRIAMLSRLTARLSFANVISLTALVVALGGSAYAAVSLPKNSV